MKWIWGIWTWLNPRAKFPALIKKHWYCGAWYLHISDLGEQGLYSGSDLDPDPEEVPWPVEGKKIIFNYHHCNLSWSWDEHLIDGLIPAVRVGNRVGLYRVKGRKYHEESFYDGAPWDDGYKVDLELVQVVPVDKIPWLKPAQAVEVA